MNDEAKKTRRRRIAGIGAKLTLRDAEMAFRPTSRSEWKPLHEIEHIH